MKRKILVTTTVIFLLATITLSVIQIKAGPLACAYAASSPDLTLSSSDISFSNDNPIRGELVTINARVYNIGSSDENNVAVGFYDGDPDKSGTLIGASIMPAVPGYRYVPINDVNIDCLATEGATRSGDLKEIYDNNVNTEYSIKFYNQRAPDQNPPDLNLTVAVYYDDTGSWEYPEGVTVKEPFMASTYNVNVDIDSSRSCSIIELRGVINGDIKNPPWPPGAGFRYIVRINDPSNSRISEVSTNFYCVHQSNGSFISTYDNWDTRLREIQLYGYEGSVASIDWQTGYQEVGSHEIFVKVDPNNRIIESDEANNKANKELVIIDLRLGNAVIGSLFDQNDANAQSVSYFISTTTDLITGIRAYVCGASSGKVIAALYAVSRGSAGDLLAQSNAVSVGTSFSWVDFQLPTPYTVTAGTTYGLAIMGNVPVNLWIVRGSGQRTGGPGYGSFEKGFTNPFGTIWFNDPTGAMSIYATGPAFGNAVIGSVFDTNDANAQSISYFTSTTTDLITDIRAYVCGASPGKVIAALYAVSRGSAGDLLAQSNAVSVGTSFSWVDFQLPTPYTVTAGTTYGLAIMGNVPVNLWIVRGSGQRTGGPGYGSFEKGFTNPFGTIWFNDPTGAMSIYAG